MSEMSQDTEGHIWVHDPATCPVEAGTIPAPIQCGYSDEIMECRLSLHGPERPHLGVPRRGRWDDDRVPGGAEF